MNCFNSRRRQSLLLSVYERAAGFTLIEVLLVLVILVVLSSIAVPMYRGIAEAAKIKAAKVQVRLFESAIDVYNTNTSRLPAELGDLIHQPGDSKAAEKWGGPYLKENSNLIDPWEDPYEYAVKGRKNLGSYDVWSLGPDSQNGTRDDIGNWGG